MKTEQKLNLTMLCDFYELTMGNGYFQTGCKDRITYFTSFSGMFRTRVALRSAPVWDK